MAVRDVLAVATLGWILLVTAGWWALALWPLPPDTPDWLIRTRAVCFGSRPDGLPDAAGWLTLVGQPVIMLGVLWTLAGGAVRSGLRGLAGSWMGRTIVVVWGGGLVVFAATLLARATDAGDAAAVALTEPATYTVQDRPAPALGLVAQHGDTIDVPRFRGRPVLVVFAYGLCETVCPLIVEDALAAQAGTPSPRPAVVVVTLDPWRDTAGRLPRIARLWGLGEDAFVLTGSVAAVEGALDRWDVVRYRDTRTGEIVHPGLVYVVDPGGRIAYAAAGGRELLIDLLGRL